MEIDYCNKCKNYNGGLSCLAFKRIPDDILVGDTEHKKPIKGQEGDFVYDPKEEVKNGPKS